jgi:hypothetical protein
MSFVARTSPGWTCRKCAQIAGFVELENLRSRTFLVRRFHLHFLATVFGKALIIGHLGDKIGYLCPKRLCSALSNAIQELLILARVSLSRGVAGKVYLSIQLSPGGKMGKCAMIIALVAGLSNSAFARDDGRYDNDPLKYWLEVLLLR